MIIDIILVVAGIYLLCGFVFAIPFLVWGVKVIDEAARGSSIGFKVMIIPGTIVFWPILLRKWLRSHKQEHYD